MARASRPRTLAGHLLAWALGALVVVWAALVVVAFHTGIEEADELTDGHLAGVAALLLSEAENDFIDERVLPPAEASGSTLRAHDYQRSMSVMVWDAAGRLVSRTGSAPTPRFEASEGFSTLRLGDPPTAWRAFARWNGPGHGRRVMVLVSLPERDDLAWDIAEQVAEPGLWLLPVIALVLGLALRRGMQPLAQLSRQVDALDVRDAQPLAPMPRHEELAGLAQAINLLVRRYHAALANERQLASEMAHELRTPLTSLALHARTLADAADPQERAAAAARVEADARRAGDVLSHLLALARASRAELVGAAQAFDLAELVRTVVASYAPRIVHSAHELSVDAPEHCAIRGHRVLMEMALRNLIDNALAHTAAGTAVQVQLDAGEHWLQVCDSGATPPQATGDEASDAATKSKCQPPILGLRLGHRVVEKVAEIHGGHFSLVPPPAHFTTAYRLQWSASLTCQMAGDPSRDGA